MQSYWLRDHPKLMRLGTQHNDDDFFILEFYYNNISIFSILLHNNFNLSWYYWKNGLLIILCFKRQKVKMEVRTHVWFPCVSSLVVPTAHSQAYRLIFSLFIIPPSSSHSQLHTLSPLALATSLLLPSHLLRVRLAHPNQYLCNLSTSQSIHSQKYCNSQTVWTPNTTAFFWCHHFFFSYFFQYSSHDQPPLSLALQLQATPISLSTYYHIVTFVSVPG